MDSKYNKIVSYNSIVVLSLISGVILGVRDKACCGCLG